jgi:hypothetical protein
MRGSKFSMWGPRMTGLRARAASAGFWPPWARKLLPMMTMSLRCCQALSSPVVSIRRGRVGEKGSVEEVWESEERRMGGRPSEASSFEMEEDRSTCRGTMRRAGSGWVDWSRRERKILVIASSSPGCVLAAIRMGLSPGVMPMLPRSERR